MELYEHAARLSSVEKADTELQERLDSLEKRMVEVKKMVKQLTMREVFLHFDDRHHDRSIQELWTELHAMHRHAYYNRMA